MQKVWGWTLRPRGPYSRTIRKDAPSWVIDRLDRIYATHPAADYARMTILQWVDSGGTIPGFGIRVRAKQVAADKVEWS